MRACGRMLVGWAPRGESFSAVEVAQYSGG